MFRNIYNSSRKPHKSLIKLVNFCTSTLESGILGIETSCDDTGCAVINERGVVLAESLYTQNLVHLRNGGIIPDIARDLHVSHIEPIVTKTLKESNLSMKQISAIAVTVKPGLPLSLVVGLKFSKYLASRYKKPIIPIHHMEAHALVVRMINHIPFPFLTLLISGGHCLLAVVEDVNRFKLLGESLDSAPGVLFDQAARRMKLRNISEYSNICGGEAIERAALKAKNRDIFKFPLPLADYLDCSFSFSGFKSTLQWHLEKKEKEHLIEADQIIPEINDLCAALLISVTRHIIHKTQRAIVFCEQSNLIPKENCQLVVSGGVASNDYIFNSLKTLCTEYGYQITRPPHKLCTDNGVMIAWNGLEKWRKGIDVVNDINTLDIEANSPLGINMKNEIINANILRRHMIKIKFLIYPFYY